MRTTLYLVTIAVVLGVWWLLRRSNEMGSTEMSAHQNRMRDIYRKGVLD